MICPFKVNRRVLLSDANLDHRALDTDHRRVRFVAEGKRDQFACRRTRVAGLEALSAIQQGSTGGILKRASDSFRGYADYMETEQFQKGVERLLDVAAEVGPTAIMCAEAVWWRCHRSLIADYLKARGVKVLHVLGANKVEPHPYTSAARIVNGE